MGPRFDDKFFKLVDGHWCCNRDVHEWNIVRLCTCSWNLYFHKYQLRFRRRRVSGERSDFSLLKMKPPANTRRRIVRGKVQPNRLRLADCLKILGLRIRGISHYRNYHDHQLWDLFYRAKSEWVKEIKKIHPDRGGCDKKCAHWNSVWTQSEKLFKRLGIGACIMLALHCLADDLPPPLPQATVEPVSNFTVNSSWQVETLTFSNVIGVGLILTDYTAASGYYFSSENNVGTNWTVMATNLPGMAWLEDQWGASAVDFNLTETSNPSWTYQYPQLMTNLYFALKFIGQSTNFLIINGLPSKTVCLYHVSTNGYVQSSTDLIHWTNISPVVKAPATKTNALSFNTVRQFEP